MFSVASGCLEEVTENAHSTSSSGCVEAVAG
jgi:hypothetical protein